MTAENLWFTERYLSVFEFLELFPADALAAEGERGVPVKLRTDLGFVIETDIERSKMQIRNRSKLHGWMRFTAEHKLRPGDRIVLEERADREFDLRLVRPEISA